MKKIFSALEVNRLRTRAQGVIEIPDRDIVDCEDWIDLIGWIKSPVDPMNLMDVFTSIRLREGFVLRGYIYNDGRNGNGIIWAMPSMADFPKPANCIKLEEQFLSPPKPPDALDDFMKAIEGDGTPWSYLSASIFAREAREFGARWHGCSWSCHDILAENPWANSQNHKQDEFMDLNMDEWTWEEEIPNNWEPYVEEENGRFKVTFITFTALGVQTLYRHSDIYVQGKYAFKEKLQVLANGPLGYMH